MIALLRSLMQKYKKQLLFPTIVATLILIFFIQTQFDSATPTADTIQPIPLNEPIEPDTPLEETVDKPIFVEIKGAVKTPGVYELTKEDRVQKAIELAGGYLPTSENRGINHAQVVQDEMVIYVPEVGEEVVEPTYQSTSEESHLININKADAAILTTLPGIGPAKAEAIIAYRTDQGEFKEASDLTKVTGIGTKTYEKLASLITVN